jgi:CzcA family heavy metal efflux pump
VLNHLIAWSLRNRLVVLAAAGLLLLGGAWTAARMPVDVLPDLTAPTVTVLAEAHGMAPEEIEALVAFPLETSVNGATGVRRVRSSLAAGVAVVWVEFDWGTEIFRARQVVAEKLQTVSASLPAGLPPPVLAPVSSVMGEIMMIGLTGPQSTAELRTVADWRLRRRLLAVPGVAQVISTGGEVRQYQVQPDLDRMRAVGVTLAEVVEAAAASNAIGAGGVYVRDGQEFLVRGLARARSVEDIAMTVAAVRNGVPVLLRDVAEVVVGAATPIGSGAINAEPGVVLAIQKQPGANTLELTRRIEAELAALQATLPEGMTLHTDLFRQADFITVAIRNVMAALRDGAVLVVVILLLFLANVRATAISVVAIPLSLAVAVFAMQLLGFTINTMTLGGMAIAIGALVDDAIIDVENVFRRLKENHDRPPADRRPALRVVYRASCEIRGSIVSATVVIIMVFLPLLLLGSVEGRLLRPLGIAYIVALIASLGVAMTVTPVLCYLLLPQARAVLAERESRVVTWLKARYAVTLAAVLAHPGKVVAGGVAALLVTLAALPLLGSAFLPPFNEGSLTVSVVTVPGTSLAESDAIGRRVERILLAADGVRTTDRRQGRAELDEHAQGVNAAEIDATLADGTDREALVEGLRQELSLIPGTSITIGQPIGHRIDHLLSGTRANIAVKVFGPDLARLRQLGGEVRDRMQAVAGVVDLQLEQQTEVPQLQLRPDRVALARFGLTPGALAEAVDVAFGGHVVSQVLEEGRSVDLAVRLGESDRSDPAIIAAFPLDAPGGRRIRLAEVAEIRVDRGPNTISRESVQRKIVVQANVAGRDLGSVVRDIRRAVTAGVSLPAGYSIEYGGQAEAQRESVRLLGALSLLAIAGVFIVLYAEFRSARMAGLVMANLPLGLIGGVAGVALTGGVVSVASLVGFITLFGIATRNGILLVSHYRALRREGCDLHETVTRGSLERLAPILMTALTAGLALLPLAFGGGKPGNELQTPMAIVILGGLLSATALNMVVLPALYFSSERRQAVAGLREPDLRPLSPRSVP